MASQFTTPPTAIAGAVVAAPHRNVLRDNDTWFNQLLKTPSAADQAPVFTSTVSMTATRQKLNTESFQAGAAVEATLQSGCVTTDKMEDGAVPVAAFDSEVAGHLFPAGLILMFPTAGDIPAGWSREDNLNGRHLIHDGTTFGETWTEASDYGTTWSDEHAIALTTGGPDVQTQMTTGSPNTNLPSQGHTHTFSGSTGSTAWEIPSRGYCYARRQ